MHTADAMTSAVTSTPGTPFNAEERHTEEFALVADDFLARDVYLWKTVPGRLSWRMRSLCVMLHIEYAVLAPTFLVLALLGFGVALGFLLPGPKLGGAWSLWSAPYLGVVTTAFAVGMRPGGFLLRFCLGTADRLFRYFLRLKAGKQFKDGVFPAGLHCRVVLSPLGFLLQARKAGLDAADAPGRSSQASAPWTAFDQVGATADHVFFVPRCDDTLAVPRRALPGRRGVPAIH